MNPEKKRELIDKEIANLMSLFQSWQGKILLPENVEAARGPIARLQRLEAQ